MRIHVSCARKPIIGHADELHISLPPGDSGKDRINELLEGKTIRLVRADSTVDGGGITLVYAMSSNKEVGSLPKEIDDIEIELACDNATLKHAFLQFKEALEFGDVDELKRIVSETLEDIGG